MTAPNAVTGPRRSLAVSDIGRVRQTNQDSVFADDDMGLWLVADGMGGHAGGARASAIACQTIARGCAEGKTLQQSVLEAHVAIRQEQLIAPNFKEMGTTVVAVLENERDYEICWVGDSRAYRFAPSTGELKLLTHDHNVAGMLVAAGALSPDDAARHPQRHVLTDCLGLTGEQPPRVGSLIEQWCADEVLLLCSDGLNGELSDSEIEQTLCSSESLEDAGGELLKQTLKAGAHDNVSVILIAAPTIDSGRPESGDRSWPWFFKRRSN